MISQDFRIAIYAAFETVDDILEYYGEGDGANEAT